MAPFSPTNSKKKQSFKSATKKQVKTEDKEPEVTLSLRLPKTLHIAIKKMAKDGKRSLNKQVQWLIEDAISQSPDAPIKPALAAKNDRRDPK